MIKVGELRASNKCWEIQTVPWPNYSDDGKAWWTVRVVPDERPRIGWLAWNGKRLAESSQLKKFREEYPELLDRLPAELERVFG
jgi:hypothetical protein